MTPEQRQSLRTRLTDRLAELDTALADTRDAAATVELDQTRQGRLSRMDAMQGQAMARAATQRMQAERSAVRRALTRIDEPDFGLCTDCDEAIHPARLAANPAATRCLACAEAAESG